MTYSLKKYNKQKKYKKGSLFYFIFFTISSILIVIVGVRLFVYLINFITEFKKSDSVKVSNDIIPPKIPDVKYINEYTNKPNIEITGNAEVSSTVYLYLNNKKYDVIVGNDGNYIFREKLSEGENTFYLNSEDSSGNISSNTKVYKVIYDKTPPELEISEPQNNSTYYGLNNEIVEIKGKTDAYASITINDRFVNVSEDGTFIYKFDLNEGDNTITIKAEDMAGNVTEDTLNINFQK